MIRFHDLVFDDFIPGTAPVYTPIQYMQVLGQGDQIGIHALCDQVDSAATLTVTIEHSTDGMNWSPKNPAPEISGASIPANQLTSLYGGETYPTLQSLEFVRLRLTQALGRGVRVRLYASVRDRVTGRYGSCGCDDEEAPAAPQAHLQQMQPHVAALLASRPEEALAELRRRLAEPPLHGSLREHVRNALEGMNERQRAEAAGFLQKLAALPPEAQREILQ